MATLGTAAQLQAAGETMGDPWPLAPLGWLPSWSLSKATLAAETCAWCVPGVCLVCSWRVPGVPCMVTADIRARLVGPGSCSTSTFLGNRPCRGPASWVYVGLQTPRAAGSCSRAGVFPECHGLARAVLQRGFMLLFRLLFNKEHYHSNCSITWHTLWLSVR